MQPKVSKPKSQASNKSTELFKSTELLKSKEDSSGNDSTSESNTDSKVDTKVESKVDSKVESKVESPLDSKAGSQVDSKAESQVDSKAGSQVDSKAGSQVEPKVKSKVESNAKSQVESKAKSQVESKATSHVDPNSGSQVDSSTGNNDVGEESSSSTAPVKDASSMVKGYCTAKEDSTSEIKQNYMDKSKQIATKISTLLKSRLESSKTSKKLTSKVNDAKSQNSQINSRIESKTSTSGVCGAKGNHKPKIISNTMVDVPIKNRNEQSPESINAEILKIENLPTVRISHDELNLEREGYHFQRQAVTFTNQSYIYRAKGLTSVPVVCKVSLLDNYSPRMKENFIKNSSRIIRFIGGCGKEPPLHPTFIRVYEIFQVDSKIYTFMDENPSQSLLDLIKSHHKFSQNEGRTWMGLICDAVQFIQKRGIAHRSIKIDHILFQNNKPKIIGWSRAVIYWDPKKGKILNQNREIKSFENSHLPPESFLGPYDPARSDNWSLGVLLCAIATKRYVFNAKLKVDFFTQWKSFSKKHRMNHIVQDFMNNIFVPDPSKRLTVAQMLRHQYFTVTVQEVETISKRTKSGISEKHKSKIANSKVSSKIDDPLSKKSLIHHDDVFSSKKENPDDFGEEIAEQKQPLVLGNSSTFGEMTKNMSNAGIPDEEGPGSEVPLEGESKVPEEE